MADVILIAFLVASLVIWISALVSASGSPEPAYKAAGRHKMIDIVLLVITNLVGGIYYWTVIRHQLKPHLQSQPRLTRQPKSLA